MRSSQLSCLFVNLSTMTNCLLHIICSRPNAFRRCDQSPVLVLYIDTLREPEFECRRAVEWNFYGSGNDVSGEKSFNNGRCHYRESKGRRRVRFQTSTCTLRTIRWDISEYLKSSFLTHIHTHTRSRLCRIRRNPFKGRSELKNRIEEHERWEISQKKKKAS